MLAMAGFTSCDDSFADWAAPSTNDPEAALEAYGITVTGSGVDVDMSDANRPDSIRVVTISTSHEDITTLEYDAITVNGCKIPYRIEGKDAYIGTYALDSLARIALKSQKYEKRALDVKVEAHALLKSGQSVAFSKTIVQNETPIPTPAVDPNGYYLLGNINDCNWTPSKGVWMTEESKGVYAATVETALESNWFKFYGGSGFSTTDDWDVVNKYEYGCDVNGDAATFNFVNWTAVQTAVISGAGKWKIVLDTNTWTYSVSPVYNSLFMTGSNYGWGGQWLPMTPIYGSDTDYWTIIYLHEGEQFKFAPQADWGNDFGGQATINDVAGANITTNSDNNLVCGKAGWYLLYITNGETRTFTVLQPKVYLMGDTAGEWNISDTHAFKVPDTENGLFESPAFAKSAELRMCVSIDGFDWWKTEFMVFDGKIEYRGRGGDQARVNVNEGQKIYLDFTNNTGEIK